MQKMGFNGLTGRDFYHLEENFQIPQIPGFPIHFAKKTLKYLGSRKSFQFREKRLLSHNQNMKK